MERNGTERAPAVPQPFPNRVWQSRTVVHHSLNCNSSSNGNGNGNSNSSSGSRPLSLKPRPTPAVLYGRVRSRTADYRRPLSCAVLQDPAPSGMVARSASGLTSPWRSSPVFQPQPIFPTDLNSPPQSSTVLPPCTVAHSRAQSCTVGQWHWGWGWQWHWHWQWQWQWQSSTALQG